LKFKSVNSTPNFPSLEEEVITFWRKDGTFKKSIEERSKDKTFSFYDGPPFATGLPHYGHIVPGTIKDIIPRFKTMQGFRVERRFGWDCHGLPIEYEMEKELKINGKQDIEKMGIDKFNEACRSVVLRFAKEWETIVERLGRWVDFKNDYKTMDPSFMESVWWVFKTLFDKNLVYQGYKSMHICPRCATPLSNFEVTLNYKDKKDDSVYVAFKLKNKKDTYFVAWTTTPWTLPANVLLAINPKLQYAEAGVDGKTYILLKSKAEEVFSHLRTTDYVLRTVSIQDYLGENYEPLFNVKTSDKLKYQIMEGDFVSGEDGTGVVHIAPAFGEDDLNLGKKVNSDFIQHVEIDGMINDCFPEGQGMHVFKLNDFVIRKLKENGALIKLKSTVHSYPYCWRCDTPLLNYATKSWFVKTTEIKQKLVDENAKIHWVPEHIKTGRFGQWLVQVRDWAISRSRYWGTPLPVWECKSCKSQKVMGSVAELEKYCGQKTSDLHKHFVDKIVFKCECGGEYRRIPEVFDCWFESGSMPYGSNHYPFENKEEFEKNHPADFISEGIDQTRGWFYTLHVLSTALFNEPAFKNCVVHGIVLAEDGQKMSKRKKNYPDPLDIVHKYGADALRFFLMNSTVIKGEDLCFSEKGVADVVRQIFLPIWNVYVFFQKNIEVDKTKINADIVTGRCPVTTNNVLDRWILSRLNYLNLIVTASLENYDIYEALKPVRPFVEELSAWYIRRSRKRVGPASNAADASIDKQSFYGTTYIVLSTLAKLLAPFTPFFAETMWKNLLPRRQAGGNEESIHLTNWPTVDKNAINEDLEKQMVLVRKICEVGNAKRKELMIKNRQPLSLIKMKIKHWHGKISDELISLIKDELNVDKVRIDIVPSGTVVVTSLEPSIEDEEYDTKITPELKAKGEERDLIRALQALRKKAGLQINEYVNAEVVSVPQGSEETIKREVLIKELKIGSENKITRS
jgi:isoleucyl-tRNA synthetase